MPCEHYITIFASFRTKLSLQRHNMPSVTAKVMQEELLILYRQKLALERQKQRELHLFKRQKHRELRLFKRRKKAEQKALLARHADLEHDVIERIQRAEALLSGGRDGATPSPSGSHWTVHFNSSEKEGAPKEEPMLPASDGAAAERAEEAMRLPMTEVMVRRTERQDAAECTEHVAPSEPHDLHSIAATEVTEEEEGRPGMPAWFMCKMPRSKPESRRLSRQVNPQLWLAADLQHVVRDVPDVPTARLRHKLRPLRTNLHELLTEFDSAGWAWALGDADKELVEARRARQKACLRLLSHPNKMRRVCLQKLSADVNNLEEGQTDDNASAESEDNFEIRRGPANQECEGTLPGQEDEDDDENDPILPPWIPDPEKAHPGDVEYVS